MKIYVLAALVILLVQTVVIAALIQRDRRRQAERELRRRKSELQASHRRIGDLAGRLLIAQEAERARIARELHDDISQQLSLLAIDLATLRSVHVGTQELVDEASSRVESIITSVHDLSRRLHPHKLRLLGLVPALQDLQNAVSHAGMAVTFTHEGVFTALPPDRSLCLFRIVQEGLQNALKHSHARSVSMHLTREPTEVVLTLVDDGVGFDVDAAWGSGLGLIGMRERLDAINGTFEIHSKPGAGTKLEIRITLSAVEDIKA